MVDHGHDFDLTLSAAATATAGNAVYASTGATGKVFADPAGGTALKIFETTGNFATGTANLLLKQTGATSTTV